MCHLTHFLCRLMSIVLVLRMHTHTVQSASSSSSYLKHHTPQCSTTGKLWICVTYLPHRSVALLHCWRDVINYESLEVCYLTMLSVAKFICMYKLFKKYIYIYKVTRIDPRKPINSEKIPLYCQLVHHKSYMDRPGIEPGSPRSYARPNRLILGRF